MCEPSQARVSPSLAGRRLLFESAAVAGNARHTPRRLGFGELGVVHHLLHHGNAAAGLRSVVPESPGAGKSLRRWEEASSLTRCPDCRAPPPRQALNVLYTRLQACLFSFFVLSFSLMKNKQIEKEVSEAMMKSLKHCDVDAVSARQPLCQYRAATIHHRLASMYHSCLRNQVRRSGAGAPPRPFARVLAASPTSQCAF